MAKYTPNLNLYEKDPVADAGDTFNIKTMMNDNWDKIDTAVGETNNNLTKLDTKFTEHLADFEELVGAKSCRFEADSFGRFDGGSGGSLGNNFMQRVARTKNLSITNAAVGGALVMDGWKKIKSEVILPSQFDCHFINLGYNDIRTLMAQEGITTGVAAQIKNLVAYLRLGSIKDNLDSGIIYSGTWSSLSPFSEFYSDELTYTSSLDAYAEYNFNGDKITVGTVYQSEIGGQLDIYIDDVLKKSVNLKTPVGYTYKFSNIAFEFRNLGEGSHTLRIAKSGGTYVYLDWIGIPSDNPPIIIVNGLTKMLDANYTTVSPSITTEANNKIREFLSEFDERVIFIDQSDFNPNSLNLLENDNFHPNDFGHEWLASNVLKRWTFQI